MVARMRKLLLLSMFFCGCSLQTDGTSSEGDVVEDSAVSIDTSSGDTNVVLDDTGEAPDTSVADTGVVAVDSTVDTAKPDTAVVDTFKPDTFVPDTFMPDTFMPDTFMPDTFMPDTSVVDTAPEAPPPSLNVMSTTLSAYNVDLTAMGTRDWAHWGHDTVDAFNRKKDVALITKGTRTGGASFESLVFHFSWTNGTPILTMPDSKRGLQFSNNGEGVTFLVKGDPFLESTLDIWCGSTGGNASITGTLTDATTGSSTATISPTAAYVVTFKFRPATAAGSLKVEFKKTDNLSYSSLNAAALR
jgi:hypothetical protein